MIYKVFKYTVMFISNFRYRIRNYFQERDLLFFEDSSLMSQNYIKCQVIYYWSSENKIKCMILLADKCIGDFQDNLCFGVKFQEEIEVLDEVRKN